MLSMLLMAMMAQQQADQPPVSAASCFNGDCIVDRWPIAPMIVFFADGASRLDGTNFDILERFAAQHRWWPKLRVSVCAARDDPFSQERLRLITKTLAKHGYRDAVIKREGQGCDILGGSRRAPSLLAYQLDFLPGGS